MARQNRLNKVLATTQGKTYTVAGITIVLMILMFFLAIRPAFLSITDQNKQNEEKRKYLRELTLKEENLKSLAEQEADNLEEIQFFEQMYPDRRNDEFFTANIAAIADQYDVDLGLILFDKNELTEEGDLVLYPNLFSVQMRITVTGHLPNLQLFLGHLENFPAAISIDSLGYSDKDPLSSDSDSILEEDAEGKRYGLNIEGRYYFWNYEEL